MAQDSQAPHTEAGKGKPPLGPSCLPNPTGVAQCWLQPNSHQCITSNEASRRGRSREAHPLSGLLLLILPACCTLSSETSHGCSLSVSLPTFFICHLEGLKSSRVLETG